jgi:hypothetical protein
MCECSLQLLQKKNLFSQTNGWQEEEPKVGPSQIVEKSREPRLGVLGGGVFSSDGRFGLSEGMR